MTLKTGECDPRAIPKEKLEDGAYYRGYCRNAGEARWCAAENLFYHWRTKFDQTFLETIRCQEDENMFDVFVPLEKLDAPTVEPIEFSADDFGLAGKRVYKKETGEESYEKTKINKGDK